MEHTIGFPNLGLEFTLSRVACTVLGKDIYWYGIIICAGFILAALYVNSRTKDFGITSDNLTDCLIICVPLGIICARIYYVVFEWGYYAQHPGEIIAIWKGGIAIYGGIIGTLIGLFVYSRVKKLSLASLCDLAAFGLLIGQCIGRWGNFMNREAFGAETTLPWRMQLTTTAGTLVEVHPTFLYESLWNVVGLLLIVFIVAKGRRFDGENTWFYFLWYGIGRFWVEGLRTDSLYLFNWTIGGQPIRVSQALSLVMVFVSLFMLYYNIKLHPHKPEELYVNIVAARNAAAEAAAAPAAESPAQATPTEDAPIEAGSFETEAPSQEKPSGEAPTEDPS